MKRYIIIALLCAFTACCAWGQIVYSTGINNVSQLRYEIEGDSCVKLLIDNMEVTLHPNQPELPIFYYTFVLPTNARIAYIEPYIRNKTTHSIPLPIKCSPKAITSNGDVIETSITDETPQYLSEELYVVSEGYFDGDIHLVTIAYSPVNYAKGARNYLFTIIPEFYIHLRSGIPEGTSPITPRNRDYNARVAMIRQMVNNPQHASVYIPTTPTVSTDSILLGSSLPLPGMGYEYLVITTRDLYDTTQKLVDWKRSKGIHAGVVCYEDICDAEIIDTQSQYTEIDDAAGHLRKYLRNAHAHGLQYAFLVAERGIIPYRRYYGGYRNDAQIHNIPTDFYYEELNNQWNTYHSQYNSYSFTGNILPDIAVGRLFVSDNDEWSSYIDRLITYERNPGHGNSEYLGKYFTIQSDEMQKTNSGHRVANILNNCFANIQTWNEQPTYNDTTMSIIWPKGKDVIDELQNNPCGYFATYAHGGQMWTTTFSGGENGEYENLGFRKWIIRSVENDTITRSWSFMTNGGGQYLEPGAGIDNLNIPHNPFITYSMSCTTMPYDTVVGHQHPVIIGVAFTTKSESAVAYLGNTREGWIGPSDSLHSQFNKVILNGITNIGIAENISKMQISIFQNILSATHNILGCPEIPMWTSIPQKIFNVSSSDTVQVVPLFCNDAPVSMTYEEVCSSSLYDRNYSIAKISKDYYPFYLPIRLQGITLQSKHTLFGGDIELGQPFHPDAEQGDFVIDERGDLTIETTGEVKLCSGTTIRAGGTLTIKHIKQ